MTSAKVILDSISEANRRITTLECVFPRFILPEFNTHRRFSRNSASSRAIPIKKQLEMVEKNPFIPKRFSKNCPGMQAKEWLSPSDDALARVQWKAALGHTVEAVRNLDALGVHKQHAIRILEPFMYHTVLVTSTEWTNFFAQRVSELAQPEMQELAEAMERAITESSPEKRWLHAPYMEDISTLDFSLEEYKKISVARCAKLSYLTQDGKPDTLKDLERYEKLRNADPPHWSPFEHVAVASPYSFTNFYNLTGWINERYFLNEKFD